MDFLYLGYLLLFAVASFALVQGCNRLGGKA
ncbi:potassium ABC transporter ATPase [Undibacterium crateris]|nr:potassium ABC transporter ATPase [Undibacterium crateris]